MSADNSNDLVGAVLNGRWRLLRMIGEGGMGAVYEADGLPGVGKRAIKLLHQEFVKEELILARFFAESQATKNLNHPNVVQVLETATAENGTPYLVMELLQGIPVSSYVDQGQVLPTPQAVHIAHGVLQALSAAHARGIIHRDIKPDNLFLVHDANGSFHTKVLDFGIAKVMDAAGGMGQKTRTGVLLGTPGYMSPEQIKNSKGVDARADLWSVGIIFYELLTGTSPFPADNEFARLTSVLTEEVKPIEQVMPHLASWSAFFQRALAKDPTYRFQSADEMASALLSTARGPSMRPPPTLQGPQPAQQATPDWRASQPQYGGATTGQAGGYAQAGGHPQSVGVPQSAGYPPTDRTVTPFPSSVVQTTAMGVMDHPSSVGPSPVSVNAIPGHSGLMQSPAVMAAQAGLMVGPTQAAHVPGQSGLMPSPAMLAATALAPVSMGAPSAVMSSPVSFGPASAVSQAGGYPQVSGHGSMPPPRPLTIASTPPPELPSHMTGGNAANIGPTHVSAQAPPGTPAVHSVTPSVQVIDAPSRHGMAPYWVVGVVAFVAFGLGLALGILIG